MRGNKHTLFLLCMIFAVSHHFAQSRKAQRENKLLLKEAQVELDGEDYGKAWLSYKSILKRDPKNEKAAVNAAFCASQLKYDIDSIQFLKELFSQSKIADAGFYLARIKHSEAEFEKAISLLNAYLLVDPKKRIHTNDEISHFNGICVNARSFYSNPKSSVVKNMGAAINSLYHDYAPVIVPDESVLYFTSKREGSSNNRKNGDNNYFEDVYCSQNKDGMWAAAKTAGEPINSETNDACVAISTDGQRMIVYRTAEKDASTGNLFETRLGLNSSWEPLIPLGSVINTEFTETAACFSNDTNEFYFSSDRPGGLGGKDLYRIKRLPNGNWSIPYNLGSTVNTKFDDDAPFLHPDGITLYYSSKGHNSMGGFDVFRSLLNKENNSFSVAENLGYPINGVGDDIFFVLSIDAQRGYYASRKKESLGGMDIYQVETRFGDNDLIVQLGFAFINDVPARVKLSLNDAETKEQVGNYYSNPSSGKFILALNPLKSYTLLAESEECSPVSLSIGSKAFEYNHKELRINLQKNNAH